MRVSAIQDQVRDTQLRVYTHNIFHGEANRKQRQDLLAAGIRALDPDVLVLQETIVTPGEDQVANLLPAGYDIVHSRARGEKGDGVSIASRWPITATSEPDLAVVSPRTHDFACTALLASIAAPPPIGPLLVVNHFPDYHTTHELERERQAVIVAREIEHLVAADPRHVILAGDMDADPDAASMRFFAGKQSLGEMSVCYVNAWDIHHAGEPGATFGAANPLAPATWPFSRIDHILLRCGDDDLPTLEVTRCELAFDEPHDGIYASDHFGLVADFDPRT
jgi:endonuclease/exonuclease/phosphatase family metal-dependent hydrolase